MILDTHIWLFLLQGDERLIKSNLVEKIIDQSKKGEVKISSISLWEVSMLAKKERITLPMNPLQWIQAAIKAPGFIIQDITPEIAYESTNLPGEFHGDPADRLIVATSRVLNIPLVTLDQEIKDYAKHGFINIIT